MMLSCSSKAFWLKAWASVRRCLLWLSSSAIVSVVEPGMSSTDPTLVVEFVSSNASVSSSQNTAYWMATDVVSMRVHCLGDKRVCSSGGALTILVELRVALAVAVDVPPRLGVCEGELIGHQSQDGA